MITELDLHEMKVAAQIGLQRQLEDINAKKKSFSGENKEGAWSRHIEGALSECALAKAMNVYWNKRTYPLPDVGDVDCRCTPYHTGHLPVKADDPNDRKFYLLVGINGKYRIAGWIWGKNAKQQHYWGVKGEGRDPCYWIPQSDLIPYGKEEIINKDFLDD
jgi:hypothetical protein